MAATKTKYEIKEKKKNKSDRKTICQRHVIISAVIAIVYYLPDDLYCKRFFFVVSYAKHRKYDKILITKCTSIYNENEKYTDDVPWQIHNFDRFM